MMKKNLFFAAVALVALASCASDDYIGENNNSPNPVNGKESAIVFSSGANAMTRTDYVGSAAATLLNNNFVVYGVKSDGTINGTDEVMVFDHYNVKYADGSANSTTSNTDGWEYVAQATHTHSNSSAQTIKYWDYAMSQYDFIAYSAGLATEGTGDGKVNISAINPAKMTGVDSNADGKIDQGAYTIEGDADDLAKCYIADLVTAYRTADYQKTVQFKFRSLSAKVRVALYETVPGYSVKDVVFYTDASTVATDGEAHLYTTGSDVFNEIGTYTVYYPTTGSGNTSKTDYNKAHLAFTPSSATGATPKVKSFGAFAKSSDNTSFAIKEDHEADDDYLGRASDEATYAGVNTTANPNFYTVVIPNEDGAVLNLKVNYTLVSTDGSGEEINVTGATALVPAKYASWKSGYAYTYLFKISHNSNGQTGTGTTPAGLYPITFDAVVMNSEADGVQETITTVATPSITTYTKGKVVTDQSEYSTGANIYVVVDNGTALTVGTNAKLYTVTLADGAAQTLNEASIGNALKYGADGTAGGKATKTVTDANGKSLVVTEADGLTAITEIAATDAPDGNAITVNGAKFAPASAGNYVFAYRVSVGSATATTAAYDPTATYYSMTPTTGTGFYLEATPTAAEIAAWDSNKSKYTTAPTQPVYAYKIIIVQ